MEMSARLWCQKNKKWWVLLPDGKLQVVIFWKSKQLEVGKGKNPIEVDIIDELVPTIERINHRIELGDFDIFIS